MTKLKAFHLQIQIIIRKNFYVYKWIKNWITFNTSSYLMVRPLSWLHFTAWNYLQSKLVSQIKLIGNNFIWNAIWFLFKVFTKEASFFLKKNFDLNICLLLQYFVQDWHFFSSTNLVGRKIFYFSNCLQSKKWS